MRVLITGSNSFIGKHLCIKLNDNKSIDVIKSQRNNIPKNQKSNFFIVQSIDISTNWSLVLKNVDVVVHLASHMSDMNLEENYEKSEYKKINEEGTLNLVRQSMDHGIKKFIFLSTIGVYGTKSIHPFKYGDKENPSNFYSESKLKAEKHIYNLLSCSKTKYVIIRSAAVYGPNNKGSFGPLLRAINLKLPLPLKNIRNKRSFISINSLTTVIKKCIEDNSIADIGFNASDQLDKSTPEIIELTSLNNNLRPILFNFPPYLLKIMFKLFGMQIIGSKLLDNFQVDSSYMNKFVYNIKLNDSSDKKL